MKNHKYYETAKRAYYGTSHYPEKRAESECKFFDEIIEEFTKIGADESALIKFESLFNQSLRAKSNCLSSLIAGPSNFPVRRAEKANAREAKTNQELLDFLDKVRKAVDKKNNPEKYASDAIRSDDENAIDKLKAKLEKLQKNQELMKACNKIVRDKQENKIERLAKILEMNEDRARTLLEPDSCGRLGFASFSLTNNNANIKTVQARIKQLESAASLQTKELIIAGVKVVQNAELMRIQFFFDGKPIREIIDIMKRNGFKWSPSNVCWQRLWNNNAIFSIKHYIEPELIKFNII